MEKNQYNVKILRVYLEYLKVVKQWSEQDLDNLFIGTGIDKSYLQFDDNWFNQSVADKFYSNLENSIKDNDIAYEVGAFSTSIYSKGISGLFVQGLLSPTVVFNNINDPVPGISTTYTHQATPSTQRKWAYWTVSRTGSDVEFARRYMKGENDHL